jgi:anti-sigma B factor antagonist
VGVESLTATLVGPESDEGATGHKAASRCHVILTVERNQIPPDITVLGMTGRIVLGNNSRDVELTLAEILRDKAKKIIFDLKGVTMLDSTGVGILVVCQGKITKEGGELRVAGATGIVQEVLKVTGVDKLFRLFSTVTEAATGF